METWLKSSGASTNQEMSRPRVRAFHDALVRYFHAMQRSQRCLEVILPTTHFPRVTPGDAGRIFMCRVADNMNPRVWTQDRELVLRVVRPGLFGVDPDVHGGQWMSQPLIDTFVYGLRDQAEDQIRFVCPKALAGKCPGRKTVCSSAPKKDEPEHACT